MLLENTTSQSVARRGFRVPFDRLTRYCLSEICVPAVLAMLIIGFVGVANELRERRVVLQDKLEFISGWDLARLLFYFSPTLIAYLVPIAFMMGILLAFGRLAQNNEITAMKAAGIPLKRLVIPVVLVGALLSAATFFLQDRVQPKAIERANQLLFVELPQRLTLDVLPAGVMNDFRGVSVYFKSRDAASKTLHDIVVVVREAGRDTVYHAESAKFEGTSSNARLSLQKCVVFKPRPGDDITTQSSEEVAVNLSAATLPPPPRAISH